MNWCAFGVALFWDMLCLSMTGHGTIGGHEHLWAKRRCSWSHRCGIGTHPKSAICSALSEAQLRKDDMLATFSRLFDVLLAFASCLFLDSCFLVVSFFIVFVSFPAIQGGADDHWWVSGVLMLLTVLMLVPDAANSCCSAGCDICEACFLFAYLWYISSTLRWRRLFHETCGLCCYALLRSVSGVV